MVKGALGNQKDAACWVVKWVLNSQKVAELSLLSDPAYIPTQNVILPNIMPLGCSCTGRYTTACLRMQVKNIKYLVESCQLIRLRQERFWVVWIHQILQFVVSIHSAPLKRKIFTPPPPPVPTSHIFASEIRKCLKKCIKIVVFKLKMKMFKNKQSIHFPK